MEWEVGSPTAARQHVLDELQPYVDDDRLLDIELVASELVTNAFRHGKAPVSLRLTLDGQRVMLAVGDAGGAMPHRRAPTEGGYGLGIVESVCDAVQYDVRPGTTEVRCTFDRRKARSN